MEKLYNNDQIQVAISKLNTILPVSDVFDGQLFQKFYKATISQDFTQKDLKRININKCKFVNSSFKAAAGTGSKFTKVKFRNCNFSGANFQYCYFYECSFEEDTLIKGANFSHSTFVGCRFNLITIMRSTLFDCYFENCTFETSVIKSNTFENSAMYNCNLCNIDLAHINLEYLRFNSIHMDNVKLPPYQIPYIIGAPTYLKNTSDKVTIYSDNNDLERNEYCNLFEELAMYFYSQNEFFPLANIYISLNKHAEAFECIQAGIKIACDYLDFRLVKHFCKLACSNPEFTHSQLKQLYDIITELSYENDWDVNALHSYLLNIGEVKEILLNNSLHKHRVEFVIKTDIDKDDLKTVNRLYNHINDIIKENCSNSHVDTIELRHNSPYELFITCIDMLPNILFLVTAMYSLLAAGNKFVDIIKNFEETRRIHQQNQFYKYEREEKILDIELKKKQLEQMERQTAKESNIYLINEIEHNIRCNTLDSAKEIAPEYLHYKYSRHIPKQE